MSRIGDEFDRPFAANDFAHAVEIAELESVKRGWTSCRDEAPPRLVVADAPECGVTVHCWPVTFAWGDWCHCGRYRLRRTAQGGTLLESTDDRFS